MSTDYTNSRVESLGPNICYDFSIEYKPRKENIDANALSSSFLAFWVCLDGCRGTITYSDTNVWVSILYQFLFANVINVIYPISFPHLFHYQ